MASCCFGRNGSESCGDRADLGKAWTSVHASVSAYRIASFPPKGRSLFENYPENRVTLVWRKARLDLRYGGNVPDEGGPFQRFVVA